MKQTVLKVHPKDNVLVALKNLSKGEAVKYNDERYVLTDNIAAKHKFFVQDMKAGDEVIMYGVLVGKAQTDIPAGGLMTTENIKHAADPFTYGLINTSGRRRMYPNSKAGHSMVIIAAMEE